MTSPSPVSPVLDAPAAYSPLLRHCPTTHPPPLPPYPRSAPIDLKFGREFTAAIESKQVAEQDAERARFLVEKSEQEKKAAIIRAEGESQAAKVVSEALEHSPALVELRRIEAAKDIAETLSKSRNVTYLPSGGQNMLLNLGAGGA